MNLLSFGKLFAIVTKKRQKILLIKFVDQVLPESRSCSKLL